ncbi:MAG: glycosyltransferase [Alphaproteobacteria bacterium]|nr:glycosyltransferase [Alphaproteobacteria bacterium]MBR3913752.1 glycosyltransferase [Alphaproteobacteria bacterium]
MKSVYEIARIVMPTASFSSYTNLFLNTNTQQIEIEGKLQSVTELRFDTWMNLFAAKKYNHYCDLGNIYLKLNIKGKYKILVTGCNRSAAFDIIKTTLVEKDCSDSATILIPNATTYEGIYFSVFSAQNNQLEIQEIAWCTDKQPVRDNKLAIVTCTFKREDYILKNIEIFNEFIQQNSELKDKIQLVIVDNGKTLSPDLNTSNITIYPNMNAGGAGGFARGLMEVMKNQPDISRILFMDDDVEIFPESFYRTLLLSNYLKDEYKGAFINGAMMDLYRKDVFFENLSVQHRLWLTGYYNNIDVTNIDNVMKTNDISFDTFGNRNRYVSSAWWYCSFPTDFAKEKGLPMPIFFRGDDAEWSWRACGTHIISMNGICVWHSPFIWRVSKAADSYYLPRNMFLLNVLYTSKFKKYYKSLFKEIFQHALSTYDYVSLELLMRAMKDILKGSDVFRENPEKQFQEINKINKKIEYIDCPQHEVEYAKHCPVPKIKKWKKLLYKLTQGGIFCPKKFFKKSRIALEWCPPKEIFMFTKKVHVYNLLTQKCEVRKFNAKKLKAYRNEFKTLLTQIDANYDKLKTDYQDAHKEFSTFAFWEKYLELK